MIVDNSSTIPPAVPGHSRWTTFGVGVVGNNNYTSNTVTTTGGGEPSSTPTTMKRKGKAFPIPPSKRGFYGEIEATSSSSNPNTSNSNKGSSGDRRIKDAFRHLQDIRSLLVETGTCRKLQGFVYLHGVEKMIIKCYNNTKTQKMNGTCISSSTPKNLSVTSMGSMAGTLSDKLPSSLQGY